MTNPSGRRARKDARAQPLYMLNWEMLLAAGSGPAKRLALGQEPDGGEANIFAMLAMRLHRFSPSHPRGTMPAWEGSVTRPRNDCQFGACN
jgi:hypothetical protein